MSIDSLYVHIPFCHSICPYCDFTKVIFNEKWAKQYVLALLFQLEKYKDNKFKTIYIGGGTPTSLEYDDFKLLLCNLKEYLDLSSEYEWTIETNIDSISEEYLSLMKEIGVNRISVGVESTLNKNLKLMERNYDLEFVKNKLDIIKKYFKNINLDFIYALPNETREDVKEEVNNVLSLDVPHLSFYSLTINKGTKYFNLGYKEASDDIQREQYDIILKALRDNGYKRYEVSNFAKQGYESKHNKTYWRNKWYAAIGIGASGYEGNIRYKYKSNLLKFINKEFEKEEEILTEKDKKEYYFITNLRLEDGFSVPEFNNLYNEDLLKNYKVQIEELINKHLIILNNDNIRASDEGVMLLDQILVKLI